MVPFYMNERNGPLFRRDMLTREGKEKELYKDILALVEPMGFGLVEASRSEHSGYVSLRVLISAGDREVNTDDLEKVYNIIYPRYQVLIGRDLELEVSSPGLQRVIKDTLEFRVFLGKSVRVYSNEHSCYVIGKIAEATDDELTLDEYLIEDKGETGERITLAYADIAKAKLEYRWEEGRK